MDDVSFVDQLLDKLESQLCVDRARVFASGESMGGMMAWELASSLGHRFAAVAPTVGAPMQGWTEVPAAPEQVSVLNLHARNDNIVPPGGGQSSDGWFWESVDVLMETWGEYNECAGGGGSWPNPVGSGPGNTNLDCQQPADGCRDGTAVVTCAINGGHFAQISGFFGELGYFFFMSHPKTENWFAQHKYVAKK